MHTLVMPCLNCFVMLVYNVLAASISPNLPKTLAQC